MKPTSLEEGKSGRAFNSEDNREGYPRR